MHPEHSSPWIILIFMVILCACRAEQPSPGAAKADAGVAEGTARSGVAGDAGGAPQGEVGKAADVGAAQGDVGEPTGHAASARRIVAAIKALETTRDVTCWTSFRQLDAFVATKEVSDYATLTKIAAIKSLARALWTRASEAAPGALIDAKSVQAVASLEAVALPEERRAALGSLAGELGLKAFSDYRKTSEHWRVVLALVQDELRQPGGLKPLGAEAEEALADMVTALSLELLVVAGERATIGKSPFIEAEHVRQSYEQLADKYKLRSPAPATPAPTSKEGLAAIEPVTGALIEAKIAALLHYNKSEGSVRGDLQRISQIPIDEAAVEPLVAMVRDLGRVVARGIEPMRADNYLAGAVADEGPKGGLVDRKGGAGGGAGGADPAREGLDYIDPVTVENITGQLFPHLMMANGDILLRFEPNPGMVTSADLKPQEVRLLDHQMNAVRDTAIHWLVMRELFQERPFAMDPFAAEILSEVLSMAMTLHFRRAQTLARQLGKAAIDQDVVSRVQARSYVMVPPVEAAPPTWDAAKVKTKAEVMGRLPEALFEDVTAAAGLPVKLDLEGAKAGLGDIQTVMGAGIAAGDLNGDGHPDLFIGGEGLGRLYVNRGAAAPGQFEDATAAWGVPPGLKDARAALFFDREGDGDLDLLILRSREPSLLLEQREGRFVDVAAGLGFVPGRGAHAASIFDFDGDGWLDIYVGFYGSAECNRGSCAGHNLPSLDGLNGTPNQLWRQKPGGAGFEEVGGVAGVDSRGWTLASLAFDHDGDGDLDLHIANDFGANFFYENKGGGRFEDISALTGTGDRGSGMNVSVTDVNTDGQWDFYITNIDMFSKNIKVVFPTDEKTINIDDATLRSFRYISGNKLYVRQSGGRYASEEQARFEPGDRGWSWAGIFFDLENDGDEDLYLSNGWIEGSYAHGQQNQLFIHDAGTFYLRPPASEIPGAPGRPESFPGNSRSVVAADIDLDGDLDLVVNNFRQPPVVLRNLQPGKNRWLGLRLVGEPPNTQAVGAEITIEAGGRKLRRQISCGGDYLGQQSWPVIVGLGSATSASVEVRWPNGATRRWPKVALDRVEVFSQAP